MSFNLATILHETALSTPGAPHQGPSGKILKAALREG